MKNSITIVIPCFNEQDNMEELLNRLNKVTGEIKDLSFIYLFVDDGSTDNGFEMIKALCRENKDIKAIQLSRNFGSHLAITAGIEYALDSNAVIVISADLQEPPELISELIKEWKQGYEVVWAIREKRVQSFFGRLLSITFYRLFIKGSGLKNFPKEGPSALFLLDKKVSNNWRKFKETNRMVIGMIAWMGFKQTSIKYKQQIRNAGESSFNFFKMVKLAIDSFVSFSFAPIRIISYLGILLSFIGFIYALFLAFNRFHSDAVIEGWTSIMVIILFLGGIQLLTLGIIGEYVWRGVDESRRRPLYLIKETIGLTCKD